MAQIYRILLHRHFKTGEVDPSTNLAVDLVLDDRHIPTNRMTQFGAFGGLAANSLHVAPFSLYTSGEIDFGTRFEAGRWGRTDLLSGRAIEVGEYFSVTLEDEHNEELTYQVTALQPLL